MAKKLLERCEEVSHVDTYNPIDPNDSFSALYSRLQPTEKKPLIVVLEEVDCIISKIIPKKGEPVQILRHEHLHIQIMSKTDWNKSLDRFENGYYQNVIILMTSNESLEFFNDKDYSCFRIGRVNIKLHIPPQVKDI